MKVETFKQSGTLIIDTITDKMKEPEVLGIWGNEKLGGGVLHISGIAYHTCPGATDWCKAHCYAIYSNRKILLMPDTILDKNDKSLYHKAAFYSLWAARDLDKLYDKLMYTLSTMKDQYGHQAKMCRFHVDGDFQSAGHISTVRKVVEQFPKTAFYCYTRSWVDKAMLRELRKLNKLPNFKVLLSFDDTSPGIEKRELKGFSVANIYNEQVDYTNSIVCPNQTSTADTCMTCKLCFNKEVKKDILFLDHRSSLIKKFKNLKLSGKVRELVKQVQELNRSVT